LHTPDEVLAHRGRTLSGAWLEHMDLRGQDLEGTRFEGLGLRSIGLRDASLGRTAWQRVELVGSLHADGVRRAG
jgi:uncharacterized protein YjbI with pentapeptide repeats